MKRLLSLFLILATPALSQTPKSNSRHFQRKVLNPLGYIQPTISAVFRQARDSPHEWGRGAEGFAKRFASAASRHAIKTSIKYGVGSLLHEELHYQRSPVDTAFKLRLRHALLSTVLTQKKTTGNTTLSVGEISGALGSGLISRLWQPVRLRTVSSGFSSAGIVLASDAGFNVLREFWPEIRHPRRARQSPSQLVPPPATVPE